MGRPVYDPMVAAVGIAVAALAPLLGLIGVWVGVRTTQVSQRQEWARDRKLAAISGFVEATTLLYNRLLRLDAGSPAERQDWMHALQTGRTTVYLLCGTDTQKAAEDLVKACRAIEKNRDQKHKDAYIAALREFTAVARRDLHR